MRLEELEPDLCENVHEFSFSVLDVAKLIKSAFAKGASFRFKVKGSSMNPFIKDGDIVTLAPAWRYQAYFGRPVVYVCPLSNKLKIHRVVAKEGEGYLIKGDNCCQSDYLKAKESILGCVTKIERGNKDLFLSLGPERMLVAFLSKNGLLPLVYVFWQIIPKDLRDLLKCKVFS